MTEKGQPVGGVKVRLEGAKSTSTTTDGNGHYAFSDLRAGGNYLITPIRTRMNFTPGNSSFTNLTQDGLADFNGVSARDPTTISDSKPNSDSKPVSECTEADQSRERMNIIATNRARWLRNIEGESRRVIAENVRDGERAEAKLVRSDAQISFLDECNVAQVTITSVWQINTIAAAEKPPQTLNVRKQRRVFCRRSIGGWWCQ